MKQPHYFSLSHFSFSNSLFLFLSLSNESRESDQSTQGLQFPAARPHTEYLPFIHLQNIYSRLLPLVIK